jgi:hypothetical protein
MDVSVGSTVILERSTNSIQFSTLHSISLSGTVQFVYKDNTPLSFTRNFYRLKIVMPDGKILYSEIKVINFSIKGNGMDIYPNPATNALNINISNIMNEQFAKVKLINQNGQIIKQLTAKTYCNFIDVSQLPYGTYIIQLWSIDSLLKTNKIMIMN